MDPEKVLEMVHPHVWCDRTRDVREDVDFPSEYGQIPPVDETSEFKQVSPEVRERARKVCEKFQRGLIEGIERRITAGQERESIYTSDLPPGLGKAGRDQTEGRSLRGVPNAKAVKYADITAPLFVDETVMRKRQDFDNVEARMLLHKLQTENTVAKAMQLGPTENTD